MRPVCELVLILLLAAPGFASAASDEDILKRAEVGADAPALREFFRRRTPTADDRKQIDDLVKQLGSKSFAVRDRATHELIRWGQPARPFLLAVQGNADIEVTRRAERCLNDIGNAGGPELACAAVRQLAKVTPKGAVAILVAFAPNADDREVEEAVLDALLALCPAGRQADPVLVAALADEMPARRAVAAHVLGRRPDQRPAVRSLLADKGALVRLRAGFALLHSGDRDALPALIALLADAPMERAWQIEEMLFRLAGNDAPSQSLGGGTAEDRKKCKAAWEAWWQKHGNRIDLARAEDTQRLLGLTLAVEFNTDRVWECGPDGTIRWQVAVKGPMEAWLLPGNRLLIAAADSVIERDLQGTVFWKVDIPRGPTGCQRLPDGQTFVSTYDRVMQFDRAGKKVFDHSIPGSNAIRKHRNGNIIYTTDANIVELNPAGQMVRQVPLPKNSMWVGIEDLPGDRFVVANSNTGRVIEIDAAGKIVWEAQVPSACGVTRLPTGNTLVATAQRVVELDRAGKVVWEKRTDGYARRVHRR